MVIILKIYSFSKFQVYNTVLLTIVTMLYIRSPDLIIKNLLSLTNSSLINTVLFSGLFSLTFLDSSYLLGWLLSKRQEITSVGDSGEKRKHLCTVGSNVNWYNHYKKEYGALSRNFLKITTWSNNPIIEHWVYIQRKWNHVYFYTRKIHYWMLKTNKLNTK